MFILIILKYSIDNFHANRLLLFLRHKNNLFEEGLSSVNYFFLIVIRNGSSITTARIAMN
jgi:hypothetical protein